jgi:hypothetical protein
MASHINDLPTTSPHGSDFGLHPQILGLATDPNLIRGTATAQCTCVAAFICNSLNSTVEPKFAMSVAVAFTHRILKRESPSSHCTFCTDVRAIKKLFNGQGQSLIAMASG